MYNPRSMELFILGFLIGSLIAQGIEQERAYTLAVDIFNEKYKDFA